MQRLLLAWQLAWFFFVHNTRERQPSLWGDGGEREGKAGVKRKEGRREEGEGIHAVPLVFFPSLL